MPEEQIKKTEFLYPIKGSIQSESFETKNSYFCHLNISACYLPLTYWELLYSHLKTIISMQVFSKQTFC